MQLVFHPPYDKVTVCVLIGGIIGFGWGSMYYGFVHQQVRCTKYVMCSARMHCLANLICLFFHSTSKVIGNRL
jgi:hypothetical protein